ncbi:MAG TPA: YaiI/YqxD family protein [Candidatus Competibacteraceae bacterium]|mgnify:CR=1 FL=1|nr:MAG: YaiI/YqxD family protein [Candidatus Competibacteraceae bacterium]HNW78695.1 YaiI/YqxD family protein [Candidatus Competibacteraceae bacterium]HQC71351.1 YaiI/YqxD family protein [Candidatus Competibacteraceae bacterium]
MPIWIDADACPAPVKVIVFRAAQRRGIAVTLVANQRLQVPPSPLIRAIQVSTGLDAADDYLVEHATASDLVITADIPLAARLVERGVPALNPRGELYTADNVRERLALRNLKEELRAIGTLSGGPPPYHERDKQAFANSLDRWLTRQRSGR